MQKAFSLQTEEQRQAMALEDEQRNLLAQLGTMSLQKKAIRKRLPQLEEEQRKLVRDVVRRVGVEQFTAARIGNGNLVVEIPDEAPAALPSSAEPLARTNGAAAQ